MTDQTTFRCLLAAICMEPAEDTPRLVMADFLDEEGEGAWAEFIRMGIQKAKLKPRLVLRATITHHGFRRQHLGNDFDVMVAAVVVQGVVEFPPENRPPIIGMTYDLKDDFGPVHHLLHNCVLTDYYPNIGEYRFTVVGTPDPDRLRYDELQEREHELMLPHHERKRWIQRLPLDFAPKPEGSTPKFDSAVAYFSRGFVSSLGCRWREFLGNSDKFYWRPWCTRECPDCKVISSTVKKLCPACAEKGNVSRVLGYDCPLSAQPIERVELLDIPQFEFRAVVAKHHELLVDGQWIVETDGDYRHRLTTALGARYPGITFTIPMI